VVARSRPRSRFWLPNTAPRGQAAVVAEMRNIKTNASGYDFVRFSKQG
jgi:hypothetical protein